MVQRDTFSEFSIHVDEFVWENFIENVREFKMKKGFTKSKNFSIFGKIQVVYHRTLKNFFFACGGLFWKESVDENF